MDYANGKIYKITNCENDLVYVGSTCTSLTKRFSRHKCRRIQLIHRPLYKLMTELGNDKFSISLIEAYPCTNHTELLRKEGEYIRSQGTLNTFVAGRTNKEYNKETGYSYYHKNIEYCKQYRKTKYEYDLDFQNRVKERRKQQWENNKDKMKEQQKVRWTCDRCGGECRISDKARHMKSKKCINFVTII
jgi:hypothetical protein